MRNQILYALLLTVLLLPPLASRAQNGSYHSHQKNEHQVLFQSTNGSKLRFQFYSNRLIRVTRIQKGETFFADDRYEMVANHRRTGQYHMEESSGEFRIRIGQQKTIEIILEKSTLQYRIMDKAGPEPLLAQTSGTRWHQDTISTHFRWDSTEHFCGMGHQAYGHVESIDLSGKKAGSNYGEGQHQHWGPQGVLTVPFYMSSKGYGIFLNTTHHHQFNFGRNGRYGFSMHTKGFEGQMDYFFLYGPHFKELLDQYTGLTGRPRLPQRSIFGLQLSDKGSPNHSGAKWWKDKITAHRNAGFPFDHIVNDNRWRAGSGGWSGSWFEWDSTRFPDPKRFNTWCNNHRLTVTLDLNRNIINDCEGWKPSYNLPDAEKYVAHGNSAPDYSNPAMRNWIWELFWKKSFNPALQYPGDGLWIDETDDLHTLNDSIICANGRSWAENENYYPFLIAKAIVQEGWDNENNNLPPGIGQSKRPYVWMRSAMAGAQRYTTHWTGDIYCNCQWMKNSIRALQASGLSGFPYFNHDAGGFMEPGPKESLYIQWSMAFASLTPIWRPHGMGKNKRWPLDRSPRAQQAAMKYGKMRYQMMPYIYTYAYQAHNTGVPMARAMVIDHQNHPRAWKHDLQYMWGDEMLVAPICSSGDTSRKIWLPPDNNWYAYWTDSLFTGGRQIKYKANFSEIPVFVREGSIIPKYAYAQSTFNLDPSSLTLEIYPGRDASFSLYEDDGVSERFRTRDEKRITPIEYIEDQHKLIIHPAVGDYEEAPKNRRYQIRIHGISQMEPSLLRERNIDVVNSEKQINTRMPGIFWNEEKKILILVTQQQPVDRKLELNLF